MTTNKAAIITTSIIVVIMGYFLYSKINTQDKNEDIVPDYKNTVYVIDDQRVKLEDGIAKTEAAPGSAATTTTRYFGNELEADLNGDGRDDIAFILTQDRGGSGTFFYAVAALNTGRGYVGSDGYFLGDRIAPQSTTLSQNPRHQYVVTFHYADRAPSEPMTTQPSIGKSAHLKLDETTMQWGVVASDLQ